MSKTQNPGMGTGATRRTEDVMTKQVFGNILPQHPDIFKAVNYICPAAREDAIHLLIVLLESGADYWTALAALYRHAADRPGRAAIYQGLRQFFDDEVKQLCS